MYKYWGFGITILSELPLPELIPVDFENPDVTLIVGKVPHITGENITKRAFSLMGENEYSLEIKNTARYYAGYGKIIIIEPFDAADEHSVRLFLLGTIMAAIIYQRGSIPLHASAIVRDGKLTLFTGNSGAGKSTLLAYLSTKGYIVFTDDICVVNFDKKSNLVQGIASYPMIKLWEDSLDIIKDSAFTREFKIRPQLPKYGQFFHDSFHTESFPIEKVFILDTVNGPDGISYTQLTTLRAFKRVERQAYRYRFATGNTLRQTHFSLMSALTNQAPVIEVKRPFSGTSIEDFSNLIETLL